MIRIFIICVMIIGGFSDYKTISELKKEIEIIETKNFELQLEINDLLKIENVLGTGIKNFKHKTAMKYRGLKE